MKVTLIAFFTLISSVSFARTSIDKCVDDALAGARKSLTANENLNPHALVIEEGGMLIRDDEQYLRTRKELEMFCRRLYIATVDIGD